MARHLIFCEEETTKKFLGRSSKYSYVDGMLSVYRYGELVYQASASDRDAYEVKCTSEKTSVKKITLPSGKRKLIGWLCGVPFMAICANEDFFDEMLHNYYHSKKAVSTSAEWEIIGNSYRFMWNKKEGKTTRPYCIACFIDKEITNSEILELLPMMREAGYPDWYLFEVLNKRFAIAREDFEVALATYG